MPNDFFPLFHCIFKIFMDVKWHVECDETHRVQHEAVDSLTRRQNQHGGTAVEGVTRGNDISTWQQGILLTRFTVVVLKHAPPHTYTHSIIITINDY